MAGLQRVNRERLASTDHFRLQVNADKLLIALGYNAMSGYLNREAMALIRNQHAKLLNDELEHQLRVLITSTPAFVQYLHVYLKDFVDPELHAEAKALWRRNGWNG